MSWIDDLHKQTGGNDFNQDVNDWLSLGYLPLNKAISGSYKNGLPVGRITEIYGGSSSGKTLLATMAMIETQKRGGLAVLLDHEYAFSLKRAQQLGLSIEKENWLYKQPMTAEEGLELIKLICQGVEAKNRKEHVTVVVDSVASMVTREEMDAGADGANMRTRLSLASAMSIGLKQVIGVVNRFNVTLILVNQVRTNPGVMFGDKEDTPGGLATKFYPSVRVKLAKAGKLKDKANNVIGETVRANIVKNKVSQPFKETEYISNFADGIDLYASHVNAAVTAGLLDRTGNYISWEGKKLYAKQVAERVRQDKKQYDKLLALFKN